MQIQEDKTPEEVGTPDPQSQLLPHAPIAKIEEDEDDVEQIFLRAVSEIETQPLIQKKPRYSVAYFLQDALCLLMIFTGIAGIIWQAITYPHTLIILYEKTTPAIITTTLDVPTRALAPVTITRSATIPTTGTGYQKATKATGQLTFYNGLSTAQTVQAGTVFTGRDGEQIVTTQDAVIPPADTTTTPPTDGYTTVSAQAVSEGAKGNIAAYDVSVAFSPSITVKNLAAFTSGQDARTFKALAAKDIATLTSTISDTLAQAFVNAFPLQEGEAAIPTNCHVTTSVSHQVGEEATSVTLTASKTCRAVAYNQSQLTKMEIAAFTRTRPRASYHVIGSVQTSIRSVTPLTVTISGKWAYTFTTDYQDFLAEEIQGDTPEKARSYLMKTGVISYASIPEKLPAAEYINFLVLVG